LIPSLVESAAFLIESAAFPKLDVALFVVLFNPDLTLSKRLGPLVKSLILEVALFILSVIPVPMLFIPEVKLFPALVKLLFKLLVSPVNPVLVLVFNPEPRFDKLFPKLLIFDPMLFISLVRLLPALVKSFPILLNPVLTLGKLALTFGKLAFNEGKLALRLGKLAFNEGKLAFTFGKLVLNPVKPVLTFGR